MSITSVPSMETSLTEKGCLAAFVLRSQTKVRDEP